MGEIVLCSLMTDVFSKRKRSEIMSKIGGKWTVQEKLVHNYLKGRKVRHAMHPDIGGRPDILLKDSKTAVFLHGCFWHKCPKCYIPPKSNKLYWLPKIDGNVKRYKSVLRKLKKEGFKVVVVWEHQIKDDFEKVLEKLI